MTAHPQDIIDLLNAEQHVQVDKLREHARHGISARVRGEVWMYLLSVLSSDRTAEITFLLSLNSSYSTLSPSLPSKVVSNIQRTALGHHTHRFDNPTYAGLITSLTAESLSGSGNGSGRGEGTKDTGGGRNVSKSKALSTAPSSGSGSGSGQASSAGAGPGAGTQHQIHSSQSQISSHNQNQGQNQNQSQSQSQTQSLSQQPGAGAGSRTEDDGSSTLRSQYGRFLPPPPTSPPTRHAYLSTLEEVLGKYYNVEQEAGRLLPPGRGGEVEVGWVYLATPFVCCFARPVAVFLAFQKLMDRIRSFPPLPSRLASLLTLFRQAQPELFAYFEDEQVRYVEIATSWLTTLLSKEMWLGDVLRLWDSYLASDDMFSLHCYVCVAILGTCKETLEELDGSEVKLVLLDLPPMDVDRLLQDAANLRVSFPLPGPIDD